MIKVASWNVNSLKVRLPQVLQWLQETDTDILAVQETKLTDDNFPVAEINAAGYQVVFSGQKTYNGVAILSKTSIQDVMTDIPKLDDPQRRILIATINNLRIINLYVPNGQEVGSEKYTYKLNWLDYVNQFVKQQLQQYERLIVLGDFNIAPEPADVYDPELWEGKVLFSEPERTALAKLMALGLRDSFRLFDQPEKSYTWWDYRMAAFRRNMGLRIDHILASERLSEECRSVSIDKTPRKWERPSDHAPIVAVFEGDF